MITRKSKLIVILFGAAVFAFLAAGVFRVFASPTCPAGSTCGAIAVDSSFNVSVGTSTGPNGAARLVIVASSTAAPYSLKIFGSGGASIFAVDNSGNLSFAGNLTGVTLGAAYVSGGDVFGRLTGSPSSPFAFANNLGVNTSTQVGLPQPLSVYGNGYVSGSVGIGMTPPGYKLDVVSGGTTTARFGTASGDTVVIGGGAGKITVGTVDPAYTINGDKFATYGAEMTGVKGETTAVVDFLGTNFVAGKTYSYALDLTGAENGSDLWLFKETTQIVKNNLNGLVVMLTPGFDGDAWYVKDAAKGTVMVFAKPSVSATSLEVSYRLTAPRFDASHWSNVGASDAPAGIIIND
jgi:hypothetical protein